VTFSKKATAWKISKPTVMRLLCRNWDRQFSQSLP